MFWAIASEILQACNVQIFLTFLMDMYILKKESLKDIQCTKTGLSLQRKDCSKMSEVSFSGIWANFSFPWGVLWSSWEKIQRGWSVGSHSLPTETMKGFSLDTEPFTLAMAELYFLGDWPHAMEISVRRRKPCCKEVVLNSQQKTMWAPTALTERWKGGV